MIYPKFLKEGDTIGICAPSCGIEEKDINKFELSLNNLKKEGYKIVETENVRSGKMPSTDAKTRAKEFNELFKREDIDFIFSASGGGFLMEILPYLDENAINEAIKESKTKWFAGYSDPTSLLYYLTTKFDIATLYGFNGGNFDQHDLHISLKNALEILKGNIVKQESFEKYQDISFEEKALLEDGANFVLNKEDKWINLNGDFDVSGRLIGGCIDCLQYLVGTRFDYTKDFIEKYKEDGIIWYFDNFALKAEDLYYVLFEMREADWFKYAKGFVFGRTLFSNSFIGISYEDAIKRALGEEMPIILDADIGHVKPVFTLINGCIAHFKSKDGKGSLEMRTWGRPLKVRKIQVIIR